MYRYKVYAVYGSEEHSKTFYRKRILSDVKSAEISAKFAKEISDKYGKNFPIYGCELVKFI